MRIFLAVIFPVVLISYIVAKVLLGLGVAFFDDNNALRFDKLDYLSNLQELKADCTKLLFKNNEGLPTESEDVIYYEDNLMIIASGDLKGIFIYGPDFKPTETGIYFVDTLKNEVVNAKVIGMPKELVFIPHGMYYSPETKRLYTINHGGSTNFSTIEIFSIEKGSEEYPIIHFLGTIKGNIPFGTINDLLESSENELFISIFKTQPLPEGGLLSPTWKYKLNEIKSTYLAVIHPFFAQTGFLYCRFDLKDLKNTQFCTKANPFGFGLANGMTIDKVSSKSKNTMYVADVLYNSVEVFEIPKKLKGSDIKSQVTHIKTISLPDSPDNLDFDKTRKVITIGAIPAIVKHVEYNDDLSKRVRKALAESKKVSYETKIKVPGTMLEYDLTTDKVKRVMYHSGDVLSATSTCLYTSKYNNHKIICGSPYDKGVMVCAV